MLPKKMIKELLFLLLIILISKTIYDAFKPTEHLTNKHINNKQLHQLRGSGWGQCIKKDDIISLKQVTSDVITTLHNMRIEIIDPQIFYDHTQKLTEFTLQLSQCLQTFMSGNTVSQYTQKVTSTMLLISEISKTVIELQELVQNLIKTREEVNINKLAEQTDKFKGIVNQLIQDLEDRQKQQQIDEEEDRDQSSFSDDSSQISADQREDIRSIMNDITLYDQKSEQKSSKYVKINQTLVDEIQILMQQLGKQQQRIIDRLDNQVDSRIDGLQKQIQQAEIKEKNYMKLAKQECDQEVQQIYAQYESMQKENELLQSVNMQLMRILNEQRKNKRKLQ